MLKGLTVPLTAWFCCPPFSSPFSSAPAPFSNLAWVSLVWDPVQCHVPPLPFDNSGDTHTLLTATSNVSYQVF